MAELKITGTQPTPLFNMNKPPKFRWQQIERTNDVATWRWAVRALAIKAAHHHRLQLPLPPSYVQVEFGVPDMRRRDPHNVEPTVKPILDGLVSAGYWPDDNPEWVSSMPCTLVLQRPAHAYDVPGFTITITPRNP